MIVTNGWDAYIEAMKTAFPKATHLLCRVHLIRSVFRRMKKITFFDAESCKRLRSLFHSDDPRTVRRRVATLNAQSLIPFYHLINRPKLSKLQDLIAEQYHEGDSTEQEHASA